MFSCDLGFLNLGFDSICVFIVEIDFIFDDSWLLNGSSFISI